MAIIGMSFKTFEGKRHNQEVNSEIKVNSIPRIIEVKEVKVNTIEKKVLNLDFEFVTSYDPKVGDIKIGGDLLYMTEENKKILDQWEKEKKLPEEASLEILNYLFRRCLLKVSNIADDLQLPPPVPLPKIKPKDK